MLRFLAAFFVLFLGAAAGIALLPNPPKAVTSSSAVAAQLHSEAAPLAVRQEVRVVYPASGTQAAAITPASQTTAVPPAPAEIASVYPQAPTQADSSAQPITPAEASAQAGTKNVNLNTASVEELNSIPGVGRIGRTIASHRPYRSVEDLLRKRVIRKSVYDRIKDQVAAE